MKSQLYWMIYTKTFDTENYHLWENFAVKNVIVYTTEHSEKNSLF